MTTLNGLPRPWDSFIQGICARKKLVKFNRLWEEFSQEEARIEAQEEKMGSEDQALIVHSKKSKRSSHHSKGKHFYKTNSRKDLSRIRCYTWQEADRIRNVYPFPFSAHGKKLINYLCIMLCTHCWKPTIEIICGATIVGSHHVYLIRLLCLKLPILMNGP